MAGDRRGRKLVGYLPENLRVPRHLTGYTALEYYGNLSNVPTSSIRRLRGSLLEKVGLRVSRAEVEVLCARTGGWAAGLRLGASSSAANAWLEMNANMIAARRANALMTDIPLRIQTNKV